MNSLAMKSLVRKARYWKFNGKGSQEAFKLKIDSVEFLSFQRLGKNCSSWKSFSKKDFNRETEKLFSHSGKYLDELMAPLLHFSETICVEKSFNLYILNQTSQKRTVGKCILSIASARKFCSISFV